MAWKLEGKKKGPCKL